MIVRRIVKVLMILLGLQFYGIGSSSASEPLADDGKITKSHILVIMAYYATGITSINQEFSTKETCENAMRWALEKSIIDVKAKCFLK